jgi:hypothetical protein
MSEAPAFDDHDPADGAPDADLTEVTATGTALILAPQSVVVRRNAGLAAAIGGVASAVATAYLARAAQSGAVLDWVLAGVLGLLGIGYLAAFVDARTPLLVADPHGVRIRLGRAWRGLPWGALQRVEHTPRRGLLRDGRLLLVVRNPARLIEELDGSARRQSALSRRLYGEPFALPLGLTTRVAGVQGDLTAALTALAGPQGRVVETTSEPRPGRLRISDPRPALAHALYRVSGLFQRTSDEPVESPQAEPATALQASATPSPLREPAVATRVELRVDPAVLDDQPTDEADEAGSESGSERRELRRPGSVSLVEDTVVWGERVAPISREGHAVEPLLIDDYAAEPAEDPVIGPEIAAARTRLGLTVDLLADRTRIRPHVIESIEVDDFTPCGGDFYARGHLRTLARVLGVDVVPLLATYDERYADAPINPRRVFEAELATGAHGPIRGTRGGLNWSVLVAAVMALVLAWSVARLVIDSPVDLQATPVLNGSAGVDNGTGSGASVPAAPEVPVVLTAAGGGAQVVVRDGRGRVVFDGGIAFGDTRTLQVSPPVRVQTSDGSLTATVDGEEHGALGAIGQRAQDVFVTGG